MTDKRPSTPTSPPPKSEPDAPSKQTPPKETKLSSNVSKSGAWTSERRIKLFEAYQEVANVGNVKWDDVAVKVRAVGRSMGKH